MCRLLKSFAFALFMAYTAYSLPSVTRQNRYLYTPDGNRFYVQGVAYQPQGAIGDNAFLEPTSFIDPLANGTACARDIPFLQQLHVNAVRVYSVNSSLNHDDCMQALSSAGIYTIIDLALPVNGSIDRASPAWTTNLLDLYIGTINVFLQYNNVLAYNIGNEVIEVAADTGAAPFLKAAVRDIKSYLSSKNSSTLVGYAGIDADDDVNIPLVNYLASDSEGDSLDLWGLNNYRWCGASTFEDSYATLEAAYAGITVAAYFSEYGCITSPPRLWTEVQSIFSSQMTPEWSGGVAFSYFPATSIQGQFGMVNISADGSTVQTSDDFTRLAAQYGNVTTINSPSQSNAGSTTFPQSPSENSTFLASATLPPTPNDSACSCVVNNLSCRFTPNTANTTAIVGDLINTACSLLGQQGGNCNDIGGNGTTGIYGNLGFCDPSTKLSYVMTLFYEDTNQNPQSCNFSGNATINTNAPSSSNAVNNAISQCLSNANATFTPTSPSNAPGGSSSGSSGSPKNSSAAYRHTALFVLEPAIGILTMLIMTVASAYWTLL